MFCFVFSVRERLLALATNADIRDWLLLLLSALLTPLRGESAQVSSPHPTPTRSHWGDSPGGSAWALPVTAAHCLMGFHSRTQRSHAVSHGLEKKRKDLFLLSLSFLGPNAVIPRPGVKIPSNTKPGKTRLPWKQIYTSLEIDLQCTEERKRRLYQTWQWEMTRRHPVR